MTIGQVNAGQVAKKQGKFNLKAAQSTQALNMVNQNTPTGSQAYTLRPGADPKNPKPGDYMLTTTLAAPEQAALDQQREFDQISNQTAINQGRTVQDTLSTPVNLNNAAVEDRLYQLATDRLGGPDGQWATEEASLRNRLTNQGLTEGDEAWDKAYRNYQQSRNDQINSLLLGGRGQSVNEILQARNQPINEMNALLSMAQITPPMFGQTPQTSVAAPDFAGLKLNNANNAMSMWNTREQMEAQKQAALYGALGQLGGLALGGWAQGGFQV